MKIMKERNKQSAAPAKKEQLFNYLENYTKVGHSPQRVPMNNYHRYTDDHHQQIH